MSATSLEALQTMLDLNQRLHLLETQRDDLLKALKNLLAVIEGEDGTLYDAHKIARAAIAKAEVEV